MRIGLALPHYDVSFPAGEELSWERLVEVAGWAEAHGLGSLWISDHYFLDISRYGGPPGPRSCYEPLASLAALAPLTRRVALGTLVLAVGFRPPSLLAEAAATFDRATGGRLELGLGAGWNEPEYRAASLPFPGAGRRLEELVEAVELVREMTGRDRDDLPAPLRRPLPIWVGAKGDRALRAVARCADGWNVVWRWTPESYRERVAVLERACDEIGRDPGEIRRSVGLITLIGGDRRDLERRFETWREWAPPGVLDGTTLEDFAVDRLVGTPDEVVSRIRDFGDLGVEEIILNFAPLPFGWYPDSGQELLVDEVLGPISAQGG